MQTVGKVVEGKFGMSIYKNAKINRRLAKSGSESMITGSQSGVNHETYIPKKISINETIAKHNSKASVGDIVPLVYAMRKYMKQDVGKAEWWFNTKVKPVLEMIEKKEDNEK